jgi:hypothetical protein
MIDLGILSYYLGIIWDLRYDSHLRGWSYGRKDMQ